MPIGLPFFKSKEAKCAEMRDKVISLRDEYLKQGLSADQDLAGQLRRESAKLKEECPIGGGKKRRGRKSRKRSVSSKRRSKRSQRKRKKTSKRRRSRH